MTDPFSWSIRVGRWSSTTIRVHLLFLFFIVGKLLMAVRSANHAFLPTLGWLSLLMLAIALHELGHALWSIRWGQEPEDVQLWPLGNLSRPLVGGWRLGSSENLIIALGGPATSGALAILTAIALGFVNARFIWNPFGNNLGSSGAPLLADGKQAAALSTVWWLGWFGYINWVVFLLNLIPAPPLDGGRVLRILTANPFSTHAKDSLIAPWTARGCAIVMVLVAFLRIAGGQTDQGITLVSLAILIEFMVRNETRMLEDGGFFDDGVFGYDFSEGYTSLEGSTAKVRPQRESALKRWRRRRSELRRQRRLARESAEEERMDEILAKLHNHGRTSLTDEENRFLRRVSRRIRNRSKLQS